MFFRDAIFQKQRNEPWWFRVIRRTIALSFIFLLLTYGLSRLKDVAAFLNSPNIVIVEHKNVVNFPGFIICPESSSPKFIKENESEIDPQFSITCGFSMGIDTEILSENMNNTNNDCSSLISKAENGCLRFQLGDEHEKNDNDAFNDDKDFNTGEIPLKSLGFNQTLILFNIKPDIQSEIPSFYTLYFEEYIHQEIDGEFTRYSVKDVDNYFIEYNNVLINSGQKNIIEYSINTHKAFSSSLIGLLNIVPDLFTMEIKVNTKYIQSKDTQFVLLPKLTHFFRQEIEKFEYHPISLISTIGGFHSAIMAFYLLLFGMPRIEPWGFLQKYILRYWSLRRDFKCTLANDYNTEPGIPLVDNIEDIPKEISLEDRVQNLEYLLKDHYFDTHYLEELRNEKSNYDYQQDRHEKLEDFLSIRNNRDTSDTSLTIQVPSPDDRNYIDLNLSSPFSISIISEDGKKSPLYSK